MGGIDSRFLIPPWKSKSINVWAESGSWEYTTPTCSILFCNFHRSKLSLCDGHLLLEADLMVWTMCQTLIETSIRAEKSPSDSSTFMLIISRSFVQTDQITLTNSWNSERGWNVCKDKKFCYFELKNEVVDWS